VTAAGAPALHLVSAGAARGVAQAVLPAFEASHGARVDGTFGAVGAMRERLVGGAPCDVVVLTASVIDALARDGLVVAESRVALGRVPTGIAVRTGDPRPGVGDGAALTAALVVADGVYFPDPERATAGIHFAGVLDRLGIRARVQPALRAYPSGAEAMAAMAESPERIVLGCTQVTEILYTPGVSLVAPLPSGFDLSTAYVAAIPTRSANPALARSLVDTLTGSATKALRRAGGFDD